MKSAFKWCMAGIVLHVCVIGLPNQATAQAQVPLSHRVDEARRAVQDVQTKINRSVQNASPDVKKKADEVPKLNPSEVHAAPVPEPQVKQVSIVNDSQRAVLLTAVTNYANDTRHQSSKFSTLAIFVLIAGAALALIGSILSFLKMNRTAGIVTLIVTAVVAVPTIYPVPALADFYRALATQAVALQTDCQLKAPFTTDDYKSAEEQLRLLIVWESQNRPSIGTSKIVTDDLAKQLQTLRSGSAVVATAAALAPAPSTPP